MISRVIQRLDMGGWRLSTRIVVLSLVLLMLVQTAGFLVVRASIERNARTQIATELALGDRVWRRLLDQNAEKLRQGTALLSGDFGFRAAVTSDDVETISSALENQGDRIGATVTALLDPQLQLRASNDTPEAQAVAEVLPQIAIPLSRNELGGTVALVGHTPYQFVMVPLRAPLVIGWVLMGFPIDQQLADDMLALSGLHVALVTQAPGQPVQISLSTLPKAALAALQTAGGMVAELDDDGDTLVTRTLNLHAVAGSVQTVLLRSLSEVLAPFQQVQLVLLVITVLGLLLFGLGSAWTALRVTTPLRSLVQNAERLGKGQYDQPIQHTARRDEIGDLANAFDRMRKNISQKQDEIQKQAYWDRLTRLRNRVGFRNDVKDAIANRDAQGDKLQSPLAVITLNLDRFKHVNDILGYALGDRLLIAVAERLHARMEGGALVARLGSDEFSILLPHADADAAMAMAARIAHAFEAPLSFDDQTVDLSASMGIACWPQHALDTDTLLGRAEVAMYVAKRKTTVLQLYDPALDSSSKQTLSLLSELRHAVEHNELRLFLQPKIALDSGKVIAAEALVRWQHPVRGLVPPDAFIPFAEQTGFVRQLTLWMFDEAARQWAGLQLPDQALRISVNLSTRDLLDLDFPSRLDVLLAKHQVAPEGFCLEITESAIMDDPLRAEGTLTRLSERGFKLSIDDFGTGYSSLAYLKRLPVDELKIDKSFVMGMERDPDDAKIVRSTIDLAHNMGLSVVAEGVENIEIWHLLREQKCDEAQGYYMSKPLPVDAFKAWRERWAERADAST
ncbi:EAL domain-containing protein [Rhodoferax sp.]|uniref:putative bifunctional diguanylate cyclase/phosphodiesterase n=1 Tax=Rhodoferax sp. TaxID=50421 RepID=UPI0025CD3695|nr:EAL domain-containing protein [Rhodoferax sp.]